MQDLQSDLKSAKNSQGALQNAMNSHSFDNAKNGNAPSKATPKAAQPLVSIIVPIYNVAPYLSECLQSLTEQSYGTLDIILIDDGSDDDSLKIALDFAARDGRIFVVSKLNGGLSSARNFGLEFVRGTGLREFFEGQKSPSPCGFGGGLNLAKNSQNGVNLNQNLSNSVQNSQISVNLSQNSQKNSRSAQNTHPQTPSAREGAFNGTRNDNSAAQIQSLAQTHTFEKTYKNISGKEIQAHFTQVAPNFIKSDLVKIGDFITQELPPNALIHFVDSDDYITKNCVEKCVQALCERDLDIFMYNFTNFYEDSGEFKDNAFYEMISQNTYNTGLELLSENKFMMFCFAWQGLFKAELLNRYALRFCEGIYHEDHDFGTLLFALAGRVAYTSEPLYIYRQRANSIMTSYQSTAMPAKMPYFLEPLRGHFKDYKALRAYFREYCMVFVAFRIYNFYKTSKRQDEYFKESIQHYTKSYRDSYFEAKNFYSKKADKMLAKMGYKHLKFWHYFWLIYFTVRSYWRHPKKFLQIFGLKKDKNAKS